MVGDTQRHLLYKIINEAGFLIKFYDIYKIPDQSIWERSDDELIENIGNIIKIEKARASDAYYRASGSQK